MSGKYKFIEFMSKAEIKISENNNSYHSLSIHYVLSIPDTADFL